VNIDDNMTSEPSQKKSGDTLSKYASNSYSQYGEDGILQEIFKRLGVGTGYFVEFGASNGIYCSNSYLLYEQGWAGCYIEGDDIHFETLNKNVPRSDVAKVNEMVSETGENSLDNILSRINAPDNFDLLSIDIDSFDLAVWRGVKKYQPSCIVVEYNPTIPPGVLYENPEDCVHGNSMSSLCELGLSKGYLRIK